MRRDTLIYSSVVARYDEERANRYEVTFEDIARRIDIDDPELYDDLQQYAALDDDDMSALLRLLTKHAHSFA